MIELQKDPEGFCQVCKRMGLDPEYKHLKFYKIAATDGRGGHSLNLCHEHLAELHIELEKQNNHIKGDDSK